MTTEDAVDVARMRTVLSRVTHWSAGWHWNPTTGLFLLWPNTSCGLLIYPYDRFFNIVAYSRTGGSKIVLTVQLPGAPTFEELATLADAALWNFIYGNKSEATTHAQTQE